MALFQNDEAPPDWLPIHAIGTGMIPAPPQQGPMSRGLADYDQRSPFDLAALRTRETARPTAGRAGEGPSIENIALMALGGPATNVALKALSAAPRLAAGAMGIGGLLYGTDPAGADNPEAVKQLQTKLRDAGLYRGAIDGVMGPATHRAQQDYLAAEQVRAQKEAADAQAATAKAQLKETERKAAEDETRKQQREQGEARLRETESNVPWYRRALRDYATPIGVGLGMLGGALARKGVTKASNALAESAAARAEGLFEAPARGVPARVARVNEFWRQGGGEVPFNPVPDAAPGIAANPNASPISALYQQPRGWNALTDLGITGAFGAESGVGQFVLAPQAREELRMANDAAAADPSEMNIGRLQAAKDRAAMMDVLTNFGRAGAIAYPAASLKMPRTAATPDMRRAETERLSLERYLRKPQAGAKSNGNGRAPASTGEELSDILGTMRTPPGRLMQPDL